MLGALWKSPNLEVRPPMVGEGIPVFLNVYDVSKRDAVKVLNTVLSNMMPTVRLGGAFHVGVEVGGMEWSYDPRLAAGRGGPTTPQGPEPSYRETLQLGVTDMSLEDVNEVISNMIEDYPGRNYDVLRRNCCHFADDFCQRLAVERPPEWVHRLARFGVGVEETLQVMFGDQGVMPRNALPSSMASVSISGEPEETKEPGRTWKRPENASGLVAPL
eukprot:CAMPEP_0181507032 /NCGR_PEP_ID=MMETSP1110-20121109/58926_1 /TAXON_ID=174948 /ORGANISM="Symbiodinium sp., Strain CCMP421" /LENGTH=215 /DNA_ID=CAMNT_0023636159 /DNA_START=92 /DNA_END=740 /DNA_ORIENTATION=-